MIHKKWSAFLLGLLFIGLSSLANAKSILFLATGNVPPGKFIVLNEIAKPYGIDTKAIFLNDIPEGSDEGLFDSYDMVVIDTFLGNAMQERLANALPNAKLPIAWVWDKQSDAQNMPLDLVKKLADYYSNGGRANFNGFFATLSNWLDGKSLDDIAEPLIFPEAAIYHPNAPDLIFDNLNDYLVWKGLSKEQINNPTTGAPIIAVAFHEQAISSIQTKLIDGIVKRIEDKGAIPVAYYYPVMGDQPVADLLKIDDRLIAEAIIFTRVILEPNKPRSDYETLGIPVIQAMPYRSGNEEKWRNDQHGVPMSDVPFYMTQAEYVGIVDIQIASAMDDVEQQLIPIDEQLETQVNKALNLVNLQRKDNKDKNLTMFFWNYPAGEKNLAASFLNLPESLIAIINSLKQSGYNVDETNEDDLLEKLQHLLSAYYRDNKLNELLDLNLAAKMPISTYKSWFNNLPKKVQETLTEEWGKPNESSMFVHENNQDYFVIPRLDLGNMTILPQPPRSDKNDDEAKKSYHSASAIPSHFYLATYLWARTQQNTDAIIHLGTHGSQEWLPGKERGLSVTEDYSMLLLGDTPVVYPYIADNIGEALHARRRGRAVIISHQTPPFKPAGIHSELNDIHDLSHDYLHQDVGLVKDEMRQEILNHVYASNIAADMGWSNHDVESKFNEFLEELHNHLHDLSQTVQPLGLHALGRAPIEDHRLSTVLMMLGESFWEKAASFAEVDDDEIDEMFIVDYEKISESAPYVLLKNALINDEIPENIDDDLKNQLEQAKQWYADIGAQNELPSLISALNGKYIPTSYGGDPIRSPDAYPTGRNIYGFDPARVPTKQAWEAGKKAANELMQSHKENTGSDLKKAAFSLWSVETMRQQGVLEAQALWLLGVEPVWDNGGRVIDVKLIDRKELNRPRVDVVLSTTGLYRDHFPNAMKQLARAVQLAAQADTETDNAVATNTIRIQEQLEKLGIDTEHARNSAETRIFSSASGHYSAGLDDATMATDTWEGTEEGDQKLASVYLSKMQFAYGPDESKWGIKSLGEENDINLYAEQLRGTEAAVLSRSSNTYGMLTTDDPFQYLGGIGLAVRSLDGTSPQLYISNLRSSVGKTENAAQFLSKELATRQFHPGYIKGLMAEGYAGTLEIVNATNNLWGWTAVAREIVRDDQWETMVDVYVKDKYDLGLDEWFEENNPHALAQVMERMIEAERLGYWQPQPETLELLKQRYTEIATKHDVITENKKFLEYVASGDIAQAEFSTQITDELSEHQSDPQLDTPIDESVEAPSEIVEGMKLEQQEQVVTELETDWIQFMWVSILLAIFAIGAARQWRRKNL